MSTATQSIREIVTRRPSAANTFHRFDIDLCMQADLSLEAACRELQLSVDQVLETLADAEVEENGGLAFDPLNVSLGRFIQHIVRVHHHRVRRDLPALAAMASKVAATRGDRDPQLVNLAELVEELRSEMYAHIEKEEQVLFPFISQMDQESIVSYPPAHPCSRSVAHPISMMEQAHESAGHIMSEIVRLANHFEPPSWACATHIALFSGLSVFEADLQQHVHLESDVLFPRAIQLETEIKARG